MGGQKNELFCSMKNFRGHHKSGLYLGVMSMHFRVFLKIKVQNGEDFLGC